MTLVPALLETSQPTCVPPPPNFKPLGPLLHVRISRSQANGGKGLTQAQKAGLRFEAKVQLSLTELLGDGYIPSPYLEVTTEKYEHRALIPDGIYIYDDLVTVVEIKRQHMPESWWQLRKLYRPAVKKLPTINRVNLLTVVQSFDPAMPYPEDVEMIDPKAIPEFVCVQHGCIGVSIWR